MERISEQRNHSVINH